MAYILRLIVRYAVARGMRGLPLVWVLALAAVACVLLFGGTKAHAAFAPPPWYSALGATHYSSEASACAAYSAYMLSGPLASPPGRYYECYRATQPPGGRVCDVCDHSGVEADLYHATSISVSGPNAGTCPANSTGTSSCTCDAGYDQVGSTCVVHVEPCTPGTVVNGSEGLYPPAGVTTPPPANIMLPAGVPASACDSSGYKVAFNPLEAAPGPGKVGTLRTAVVNGVTRYWVKGNYVFSCVDGAKQPCTPAPPDTPISDVQPTQTCAAGQTAILVNDRLHCFDNTTGAEVNTNTGAATSANTTRTVNGDGTTTSVTANPDGTTTTQITNTSTGAVVSTSVAPSTNPQPEDEYCKANPTVPQCKLSSFGGSCSGGFVCTGDAAECATARAVNELKCEVIKTNARTALGEAIIAGSDPDAATLPNPATPETVNVGTSFNQATFLSGGCPADETFTVYGTSQMTIPFSRLCSTLEIFGTIMVMLAMLGAARVVGVWG